jgi:antitoxin (DNA-binding transcriptional repressor) of toxin-antitoxin stability system
MHQIDISQAESQVKSLFQAALNGDEVIITQDNQPILRLTSFTKDSKRRHSGSAKGLISMSPDFDEPLADFAEYME